MSDTDPNPTPRPWLLPLLAGLASLLVFLPGINWGLPSREADRFLFGDRTPWTGGEIIALAGGFEAADGKGADVDANPLDRAGGGPVVLNDTDAERAEIVRRYRLQSHQPDEFINFAAIAGMGQRRDLDPRLYQYGGLWLYPVAGLLGVAQAVGYVRLTGDLAFYLDDPAAFGRFYVVARLYSAAWGAAAAAAVFVLVRRLTRGGFAGFCGALAFALLPVVVTAAHEAKPHLAGAALVLWAVVKAGDYARRGRRRDALLAGLSCGAASSMVVSMVVGFALVLVMGWLRGARDRVRSPHAAACGLGGDGLGGDGETLGDATGARRRVVDAALALFAGGLLYALVNPFVVYHALFDRAPFASNLGNSTAMYGGGGIGAGVWDAVRILGLAVGLPMTGALVLAAVIWVVRLRSDKPRHGVPLVGAGVDAVAEPDQRHGAPWLVERDERALGWLLAAAAVAVLCFFVPLAAGKPAEYARFGIVPVAAGVVALVSFLARWRPWLCGVAPLLAAVAGVGYVANFVIDAGPDDTRTRVAERLAERLHVDPPLRLNEVVLGAQPAPYCAPPFDLWAAPATLVGNEFSHGPQVRISAVDTVDSRLGSWVVSGRYVTPISWANKAFDVIFPGFGRASWDTEMNGALPTSRTVAQ